ncbi:MAG: outer membrane protein assembly factor BamB [Parasphingorhabdus sp.]|jgi:outer membrane protein assembly factor BamB
MMHAFISVSLLGAMLLIVNNANSQDAEYPGNPVVSGGSIVVAMEGVRVYDVSDLSLQWKKFQELDVDSIVIDKNTIYASSNIGVHSLRLKDGNQNWLHSLPGRAFGAVVHNNISYLTDDTGHLVALDAQSGKMLWQRTFSQWVYPPAIHNENLYLGGREGMLYVINAEDGRIVWQKELHQELVNHPVVTQGGEIIITLFSGVTQLLESKTGEIKWSHNDGVASQSPLISSRRLYFPGFDGVLRVRSESSGDLIWQQKTHDALSLLPLVNSKYVVVSDQNGETVRLDPETGALLERFTLGSGTTLSPIQRKHHLLWFSTSANSYGEEARVILTSRDID